jgi:aldose 1-epimerase
VIELLTGMAAAEVDPLHGGRLASLRVAGLELLQGREAAPGDPLGWGCYPMVPWAGRVRGGRFSFAGRRHQLQRNTGAHAIHGTCVNRRWRIEQQEPTYLRLAIGLGTGWPFPGSAVHELSLRPDGLDLRLEVHADRGSFPATAGWHPWWRRSLGVGGTAEVTVPARRWYPRADDGLPLGHLEEPPRTGPFDDCFTAVSWPVRLRWPGALEVELHATADHLVVFDERPEAVCLEPQTGPPDAFNLDLATIVRPGAPLVVEAGIGWRPDIADPRAGPPTVVERRQPDGLGPPRGRSLTDRRRSPV